MAGDHLVIRKLAILRWALIGPLFGTCVAAAMPLAMEAMYGRPSFYDTIFYLALIYVLGIPAAVVTGIVYNKLMIRGVTVTRRNLTTSFVGAFVSTYVWWLPIIDEILNGKSVYDLLAGSIISMLIGMLSSVGMVALEGKKVKSVAILNERH